MRAARVFIALLIGPIAVSALVLAQNTSVPQQPAGATSPQHRRRPPRRRRPPAARARPRRRAILRRPDTLPRPCCPTALSRPRMLLAISFSGQPILRQLR